MELQEAVEVEPLIPAILQPILNANQQAAEAQLITAPRMGELGSGEPLLILIDVEAIQMVVMTTMVMDVRQKTSDAQQVLVLLHLPISTLTLLVPIPVVQLIAVLKPEPMRITIAMPVPVLPIQILVLRIVLPIQLV